MVRVGGRSKSEILEDRNLRNLTRGASSWEERNRYLLCNSHFLFFDLTPLSCRKYDLYQKAEKQEASIKGFSELKQKNELQYSDLQPLLEGLYPDHYHDIFSRSQEARGNDFVLGKKPKDVYDISF